MHHETRRRFCHSIAFTRVSYCRATGFCRMSWLYSKWLGWANANKKIKLQPKKIPNANALLFWRCFKWLVHHANSKFCSNVKKSSLNSSQFAGIVNLNLPTYIHSLRKPHTNHRETRPLAIKPISADCVVVSLKQVTTRPTALIQTGKKPHAGSTILARAWFIYVQENKSLSIIYHS